MIKGMIALSISPFLVVDDNIHIAPTKYAYFSFIGADFTVNSPSMCAYKSLVLKQDAHINKASSQDYKRNNIIVAMFLK